MEAVRRGLRGRRRPRARDRGPDSDTTPLYTSGAVDAIFRARLSAYGHTLVARGVEAVEPTSLRHEKAIYRDDRLRTVRGEHIPTCLGLRDVAHTRHYDGGVPSTSSFSLEPDGPSLGTPSQSTKCFSPSQERPRMPDMAGVAAAPSRGNPAAGSRKPVVVVTRGALLRWLGSRRPPLALGTESRSSVYRSQLNTRELTWERVQHVCPAALCAKSSATCRQMGAAPHPGSPRDAAMMAAERELVFLVTRGCSLWRGHRTASHAGHPATLGRQSDKARGRRGRCVKAAGGEGRGGYRNLPAAESGPRPLGRSGDPPRRGVRFI